MIRGYGLLKDAKIVFSVVYYPAHISTLRERDTCLRIGMD